MLIKRLRKVAFLLSALSLFLVVINSFAYEWPFMEGGSQTVEQKIRQTVCASRGGPPPQRFHRGVDICPNYTTNKTARSVNEAPGDTIALRTGIGENIGIKIGNLYYIHLDPRIEDSTIVYKGDSLGIIFHVSGTTHLHFQHGSAPPNILNPLDSLTPFTDDYSPKIDTTTIGFYQQGGGPQIHKDSLHGKVDIDVMVYDTLNHSIPEHDGRVYPYKIGYKIKDTLGYVLKDTVKIWFDKVPPNVHVDWVLRSANNTYPTFRITNVALHGDSVKDHYWNTKQDSAGPDSVDADSIEDALFKDGFFWVKVLAWDIRNNADSESVYVHVDNFDPKVKETFPANWDSFVPNKIHDIWCTFSEPMDTATLDTNGIKIKSLKADSFNYTSLISDINYTQFDSIRLYTLIITVDSFRYNDTVQVRLLDTVKDLAGKSIETGGYGYSWNFIANVLQLTDDSLDDKEPVVSRRKIVWTKRWPGSTWCGAIQLYDFDQGTTDTISPDWSYSHPVNYGDSVLCLRLNYPIYSGIAFYDGATWTDLVANNATERYEIDLDAGGAIWRSRGYDVVNDSDFVTVNYYDYNTITALDSWYIGTSTLYRGFCDIHGNEITWDSNGDILMYDGVDTINISSSVNPDSVDDDPTISYGQVAWVANQGGQYDIYLYDGSSARKITEDSEWDKWAFIDDGWVVWTKDFASGYDQLCYFDGRSTDVLDTNNKFPPYWYAMVNNKRVTWLKTFKTQGGFSYVRPRLYNDTTVIDLVASTDTTYSAGENHWLDNGFVVWAGFDGHDYEIYLYVGDTTRTPPGPPRNLLAQGSDLRNQITLTWNQGPEPDLAGYKVYRSAYSHDYGTTPYATTTDTTYTDMSPMQGINCYVVTGYDDSSNESGFSNQDSVVFSDATPPKAPDLVMVDTSNSDIILTWNKVTEDTLNNPEYLDYYVVYRDTHPDYVPASSDSIGYTSHEDTVYTDAGAVDSTNDFFYLVKAVDLFANVSDPSNQGYKFRQVLYENPDEGEGNTADKNWISIPYICPYDSASDLFKAIGNDICDTITKLDAETQQYTHCYYSGGSYVNNFDLEVGQMYEVDPDTDTAVIMIGAHDPDTFAILTETPFSRTDKNWISVPYNAVYDSASDIGDDIGMSVCYSITKRDPETQLFTTYFTNPLQKTKNFAIERCAGYEFVINKDSIWTPIVYSNKGGIGFRIVSKERREITSKSEEELPLLIPPEWDAEKGVVNESTALPSQMTVSNREASRLISSIRDTRGEVRRHTPHVCFGEIPNPDQKKIHFRGYITLRPEEVLTEKTIGCGVRNHEDSTFWWLEGGNYYTPWGHRNKVIMLFSAESLDPTNNTVYLVPYGYVIGLLNENANHQQFDKFHPLGDFGGCREIIGYSRYCLINDEIIRMADKLIMTPKQEKPESPSPHLIGVPDIERASTVKAETPAIARASVVTTTSTPIINGYVFEGGRELRLTKVPSSKSATQAEEGEDIPIRFAFDCNPTLVNKQVIIFYAIPERCKVSILVYDPTGRVVRSLVNEVKNPGYYQIPWKGDNDAGKKLSNGVYFLRLAAREFTGVRKIVLMR